MAWLVTDSFQARVGGLIEAFPLKFCLDILKIKFLSNGGQFGFKEREA
jgi:hypothetical protein